ncbi:Chromate resistance protein ChrB, partial [Streptomyces narbonensis]
MPAGSCSSSGSPPRLPRRRVAVWRELRKVGALSLGQGVWAVPDVPAFADGVAGAVELTGAVEGGEAVTLEAAGRSGDDAGPTPGDALAAARSADWAEFLAGLREVRGGDRQGDPHRQVH